MNVEKLIGTKTIDTDYLKVKGNIISWQDTVVQIRNISMISTSDVDSASFPFFSILIGLLGFFILKASVVIGLLLLATAAVWIGLWYKKNVETNKLKKLNIILNSGTKNTLVFNDRDFLNKVVSVLTGILEDSDSNANIVFNIKNNTFKDDSSIVNQK